MSWKDVESKSAFQWSHTKLSMLRRCPLQYEKRYVEGKRTPPNFNLHLGSSVHAGIASNYKHKFLKKKPDTLSATKDAFSQYFEDNKSKELMWEGQRPGTIKDVGYSMVEAHYKNLAPKLEPVKEPELKLEFSLKGMKRGFVAYLDVVGNIGKRLTVIDNKTTTRSWNQWQIDIDSQLTTYAMAWANETKKMPDMVGIDALVWNKKTSKMIQKDAAQRLISFRTKKHLERFATNATKLEKLVDAGIFYPTDDPRTCMSCGYRKICHYDATKRLESKKYTPDSGIK